MSDEPMTNSPAVDVAIAARTIWPTHWGWRARRVPGVFFDDPQSAVDALTEKQAEQFSEFTEVMHELADAQRTGSSE